MATEAQVANLAATAIGTEDRLIALAEDTHLARTLRTVWDVERRATIRDGVWNFAIRRDALAAEADVPAAQLYPWGYRYPLPAGCLRFIDVLAVAARDAYSLEGRAVLCNISGPLYVRYAVDVAEPAQWDETFARAFAYRLALACGNRIAGSAFPAGTVQDAYDEAIGSAKRVDATENPPIEQEDGSWITARWGDDAFRARPWAV